MILTVVGVSHGTLDQSAQRARGVGADIWFRPPGSSAIGLSTAPMSDKIPALLMQEPHVTFAMGTMVQPLSGFDTISGLDLNDFTKLNGGFHCLWGGPLGNGNDMIVDEYYARQKPPRVGGTAKRCEQHRWSGGGFRGGKRRR